MHHGRTRGAIARTRIDAAAAPRTARHALATAALAALTAMAATACGGGSDLRDEQPAHTASGGEVVVPGATATSPDSGVLPGTAGSGTAVSTDPSGSIGTPGQGTTQGGDPSDAGVRSLIDAINASETEMSQLALQKAQNAEVRRYAQSMIAAHRQAPLDRAVEAAGTNSANDLLVPMADAHRKTMQRLQTLEAGPAFDRAYITAQVQGHEGALQALERGETAAGDATLIDRVRRMQSDVERHLAEARRVQAQLPTTAGGKR